MHYGYELSDNRVNRTALSGSHAEHDIDEVNRIRAEALYFAGGTAARYDYGYGAKNRHKYEQRDWATADGWHYDAGDQIVNYQRDGWVDGNGDVNWGSVASGIEYDNNGNRTAVTGSNANSYSHNDLNQYDWTASTGTIGYGPKGNLTDAAGWTSGYDAQNRLTSLSNGWTTIVMGYDPLSRVITRSVNGNLTQNVSDGWNLVEEHRGDWSISAATCTARTRMRWSARLTAESIRRRGIGRMEEATRLS